LISSERRRNASPFLLATRLQESTPDVVERDVVVRLDGNRPLVEGQGGIDVVAMAGERVAHHD